MSGYIQRPGTAEDVPAINELMRISLGDGGAVPRSRAFWDWKHEHNPFGRSPVLVAYAGEQLVGVRVFMRWNWVAGDVTVPAVRAVDTATHPDWRGKRIFQNLTLALVEQMKEEGVGFVFNTPNQLSAPGYLKMGWQRVTKIPVWFLPLHPVSLIRERLWKRTEAKPALPALGGVAELCDAAGLDEFLPVASDPDPRFHTPIDRKYLSWRYRDAPGISYGAHWVGGSRMEAAIVYRTRHRGHGSELTLCEVLTRPEWSSVRAARDLIRTVAKEKGVDYVLAVSQARTRTAAVFASAGFLPVPRGANVLTTRLLAWPQADGQKSLPDPAKWRSFRCGIGDLELF